MKLLPRPEVLKLVRENYCFCNGNPVFCDLQRWLGFVYSAIIARILIAFAARTLSLIRLWSSCQKAAAEFAVVF
jgi:hypothetical protein